MSLPHASALRDEVVRQLDFDVLSYGWLLQIAKTVTGFPEETTLRQAVLDTIIHLVDCNIAVVGEARKENNMVVIHAWADRGESLREKLEISLVQTTPENRDWVFWLQLKRLSQDG